MNPQEQQIVSEFVNRIRSCPTGAMDPDAATILRNLSYERPDALYLAVQTALLTEAALKRAQQRISQLEAAASAAPTTQPSPSFLGGAAGSMTPLWTNSAQRQSSAPPATPGPVVLQPTYLAPVVEILPQPSFLSVAAETAIGVAAGALLFEAVETAALGPLGYGVGLGFGGYGPGPGYGGNFVENREIINETTVVNNYYEAPVSTTDQFVRNDTDFVTDNPAPIDDESY